MKPQINKEIEVWECPICRGVNLDKERIKDCIKYHKEELFKDKFQTMMETFLQENFDFEFDKTMSPTNRVYSTELIGKDKIGFSHSLHGIIKFTESKDDIEIKK